MPLRTVRSGSRRAFVGDIVFYVSQHIKQRTTLVAACSALIQELLKGIAGPQCRNLIVEPFGFCQHILAPVRSNKNNRAVFCQFENFYEAHALFGHIKRFHIRTTFPRIYNIL